MFGVYKFEIKKAGGFIGPVGGHAGMFAGYAYSSYCYSKNLFPYAGIAGIGTSIGQNVAANADLVLSHQFIIAGLQVPMHFSRLFSLIAGFKYHRVFEAPELSNPRITPGASARF